MLAGVAARSARFTRELNRLGEKYGLFTGVRGKGLLLGAVLCDAWKGRAGEIVAAAQQQDLMILVAGPDVLRFAPSLLISDADIDEGMARLDRALAALTAA